MTQTQKVSREKQVPLEMDTHTDIHIFQMLRFGHICMSLYVRHIIYHLATFPDQYFPN